MVLKNGGMTTAGNVTELINRGCQNRAAVFAEPDGIIRAAAKKEIRSGVLVVIICLSLHAIRCSGIVD